MLGSICQAVAAPPYNLLFAIPRPCDSSVFLSAEQQSGKCIFRGKFAFLVFLPRYRRLVHGTDIGRQIQIFDVPCLILYLNCCHDFIGCKVFRECFSVIYLLHFKAMLHKNSIGQDFHPAFLESLFCKLYKICLLLFLF